MKRHWIFDALGEEKLKQARQIADQYLVSCAMRNVCDSKMAISEGELKLIEKALEALELAGIDLQGFAFDPKKDKREDRECFHWVCREAFFLMRALPLPEDEIERAKHVLRLISFAYLGQRWADVKRWLDENSSAWEIKLKESTEWDKRLFGTIYDSWLYLIRKKGWEDLSKVTENIVRLREEQKQYENGYLNKDKPAAVKGAAWEVVSLYHLAKATEVLGQYMLQGAPKEIQEQLDFHFEKGIFGSQNAFLMEMEVLMRWLHLTSKQMAFNSLWMVVARVNSRVKTYVEIITKSSKPMFELLPPQRAAILEQGLLEPAHRAVVVDMPTSSGKTALAEFRILQALNQYQDSKGWIAYVVPTRTLVNQICARLRRNLGHPKLNIKVAKMSGAIEIDGFEDAMLTKDSQFDVLVTTPEKLDLIIRDDVEKKMNRPLALVVLDEAHNIGDKERGLKIELLLSTIRKECVDARFLLLTPYIKNSEEVAGWLDPESPGTISFELLWQPNDRVVGYVCPVEGENPREWKLSYKTLLTSHETINLPENLSLADVKSPLDMTWSALHKCKTNITAAVSNIFKRRGTVIAVARLIRDAWSLARTLYENSEDKPDLDERVKLVQRFIAVEMGNDFELINMLNRGIGIHHSGLSDEIRFLMEWLTEEDLIDILVATTTIAQGINFPVSSIFLASLSYPYTETMPTRDFWNLAGRAGRFDQETLGIIGIASSSNVEDINKIKQFVGKAGEDLVSTLVELYREATKTGEVLNLEQLVYMPQWSAFVQYLAHIYKQSKGLADFTSNAELIMRHTFGYQCIKKQDPQAANAIVQAVKIYAKKLSDNPGLVSLADQTGFSPEAVGSAIVQLKELGLNQETWSASNLFGGDKSPLKNLMGVMLTIPEVRHTLEKVSGVHGIKKEQIASITQDWVNGASMEQLAKKYFTNIDGKTIDSTTALSECCRAIYGKLTNSATWGMAALQKLPNSGIDFQKLTDEQKRIINNLPAMIYYGVGSEEALVMRMNSVPRSVADKIGKKFKSEAGAISNDSPIKAADWLTKLPEDAWQAAIPAGAQATGKDYQTIWKKFNGID